MEWDVSGWATDLQTTSPAPVSRLYCEWCAEQAAVEGKVLCQPCLYDFEAQDGHDITAELQGRKHIHAFGPWGESLDDKPGVMRRQCKGCGQREWAVRAA